MSEISLQSKEVSRSDGSQRCWKRHSWKWQWYNEELLFLKRFLVSFWNIITRRVESPFYSFSFSFIDHLHWSYDKAHMARKIITPKSVFTKLSPPLIFAWCFCFLIHFVVVVYSSGSFTGMGKPNKGKGKKRVYSIFLGVLSDFFR